MGQSLSEKRWAENEVIFRQANKGVLEQLADAKVVAGEEDQYAFINGIDDTTLRFYCECADETCHERIELTPREYLEQHRNTSQFILLPGHHKASIERIVFATDRYIVVEKYLTPPSEADKLNPT